VKVDDLFALAAARQIARHLHRSTADFSSWVDRS